MQISYKTKGKPFISIFASVPATLSLEPQRNTSSPRRHYKTLQLSQGQ